jgi:Flp pilus assembly protein CpaB
MPLPDRVAWRRALARHRRLLAAGLAAGAVAAGLDAVAPAPPATSPVVVAARDLAGGRPLAAGDLTLAALPPATVPDGASASPAGMVGRSLAGPVRRGEPVTDVRLLGPSLVAEHGPRYVAAPVRVADPGAVALLRPGDRVDVLAAAVDPALASAAGAASVVAADAEVLAVPAPLETGDAVEGALVVLATRHDTAAELAAAQVRARLSVVLRP